MMMHLEFYSHSSLNYDTIFHSLWSVLQSFEPFSTLANSIEVVFASTDFTMQATVAFAHTLSFPISDCIGFFVPFGIFPKPFFRFENLSCIFSQIFGTVLLFRCHALGLCGLSPRFCFTLVEF